MADTDQIHAQHAADVAGQAQQNAAATATNHAARDQQAARHNYSGTAQRGSFTQPGSSSKGGKR